MHNMLHASAKMHILMPSHILIFNLTTQFIGFIPVGSSEIHFSSCLIKLTALLRKHTLSSELNLHCRYVCVCLCVLRAHKCEQDGVSISVFSFCHFAY